MNRRQAGKSIAAVGAMAVAPVALYCAAGRSSQGGGAELLIGGAAAMKSLMEAIAHAYIQRHRPLKAVIEQGGSLAAYIAANRGVIDLAAMTRALSDTEDDRHARHYLIARGDVIIVVNRALGLTDLSRQQIRALLSGQTDNWAALGGPHRPVKVYTVARDTRVSQFAEGLVLEGDEFAAGECELASSAALLAAVRADPAAIGYCASDDLEPQDQVVHLAVDGVRALRSTVLSGRYPYALSFYLLCYGAGGGARAGLLDFARSRSGQQIVTREGLIAVC